jgi:hypothetical protein
MMSGTLAALNPEGPASASRSPELREHCERLIVRLQDPYFRALLTYLTSNDWSDVLEEEALPFHERLAIAFQFLNDKTLSAYLRRTREGCIARGDIEGLIVTGLTPPALGVLQSYIDRTGDVQTASILASYVSCPPASASAVEDARVVRWLDAYRDLLDSFKLFHHRVSFDIERGQLLQADVSPEGGADQQLQQQQRSIAWAPRQILIRCNFCNKAIQTSDTPSKQEKVSHHVHSEECSLCFVENSTPA